MKGRVGAAKRSQEQIRGGLPAPAGSGTHVSQKGIELKVVCEGTEGEDGLLVGQRDFEDARHAGTQEER